MIDFNFAKVTKITEANYTKLVTVTSSLLAFYVNAET